MPKKYQSFLICFSGRLFLKLDNNFWTFCWHHNSMTMMLTFLFVIFFICYTWWGTKLWPIVSKSFHVFTNEIFITYKDVFQNNSRNSRSVSQTVYLKYVLLFRAYLIRNHLLIKLVDLFSPWNHQKTMISGEIEVN